MSARTQLVTALTEALDPAVYVIEGKAAVPDGIGVGKRAIRVFSDQIVPAGTVAGLIIRLQVWVTTPAERAGAADDDLDDACDDLLPVLLELPWVNFEEATRTTMSDEEQEKAFHAWRFDLTAAATITIPED